MLPWVKLAVGFPLSLPRLDSFYVIWRINAKLSAKSLNISVRFLVVISELGQGAHPQASIRFKPSDCFHADLATRAHHLGYVFQFASMRVNCPRHKLVDSH